MIINIGKKTPIDFGVILYLIPMSYKCFILTKKNTTTVHFRAYNAPPRGAPVDYIHIREAYDPRGRG
jgi:hypothetical protein